MYTSTVLSPELTEETGSLSLFITSQATHGIMETWDGQIKEWRKTTAYLEIGVEKILDNNVSFRNHTRSTF